MTSATQQVLDSRLFSAALGHDLEAIEALVGQGADPFAPVGRVEIFPSRSVRSTGIDLGCAAALCIQWPEVLERLLPKRMARWPEVTCAKDAFSMVSRCGSVIDLGHWAVEMSAMEGLKLVIDRLDRGHPDAQSCLRKLTLSCLAGCSNTEAKDNVLNALVLCMAAQPELDRGWSHWRHFRLHSQTKDHQTLLMPMTFVMGAIANRKELLWPYHEEALVALRWALVHDDLVRSGDRRLGTVSAESIMHVAAACASIDVLKVALDVGCSLDALDSDGLTPIQHARKCGKMESVAFIESWLAERAVERELAKASNAKFLEVVA